MARLASLALALSLLTTCDVFAACLKVVHVSGYYTKSGTWVPAYNRSRPGYGWECAEQKSDGSGESDEPENNSGGNSEGTPSFDVVGASGATIRLDGCMGKFADGKPFAIHGLPEVTDGRFTYPGPTQHLFSVPLREVAAIDCGRRRRCVTCARNASGAIVESLGARLEFIASHPCPASHGDGEACPGYVVRHRTPLICGGEDTPENLQWQAAAQAAAGETWAKRACAG